MEFSTTDIMLLIGEVVGVIGLITPYMIHIRRILNGQRCQLRHDMLEIYYANKDKREIRQYEYEDFVMLYEAYKALKGNSFVDKIYADIKTWNVVM